MRINGPTPPAAGGRQRHAAVSTHDGLVVVCVLLIAFTLSAMWRPARASDQLNIHNIEASHHALLTVIAYDRIPYSVRQFLPPFNPGAPTDVDIPRGDTVRGPGGNVYYTSFPAAGIIAPWAFFERMGLATNGPDLL